MARPSNESSGKGFLFVTLQKQRDSRLNLRNTPMSSGGPDMKTKNKAVNPKNCNKLFSYVDKKTRKPAFYRGPHIPPDLRTLKKKLQIITLTSG
jgi:hypothetical protein